MAVRGGAKSQGLPRRMGYYNLFGQFPREELSRSITHDRALATSSETRFRRVQFRFT